jgi:hypothetical protein
VLLSPYWQLLLRRVAEEATVLGLEQHTHQHNHQEDGGGRGGDARAPTTAAGLPFCVCLSVCSLCVHLCVLAWFCRPKQLMDDASDWPLVWLAGAAEAEALLRRLAADPDASKLLGGQAAAQTQVR